jgi:hypothetical protein
VTQSLRNIFVRGSRDYLLPWRGFAGRKRLGNAGLLYVIQIAPVVSTTSECFCSSRYEYYLTTLYQLHMLQYIIKNDRMSVYRDKEGNCQDQFSSCCVGGGGGGDWGRPQRIFDVSPDRLESRAVRVLSRSADWSQRALPRAVGSLSKVKVDSLAGDLISCYRQRREHFVCVICRAYMKTVGGEV